MTVVVTYIKGDAYDNYYRNNCNIITVTISVWLHVLLMAYFTLLCLRWINGTKMCFKKCIFDSFKEHEKIIILLQCFALVLRLLKSEFDIFATFRSRRLPLHNVSFPY